MPGFFGFFRFCEPCREHEEQQFEVPYEAEHAMSRRIGSSVHSSSYERRRNKGRKYGFNERLVAECRLETDMKAEKADVSRQRRAAREARRLRRQADMEASRREKEEMKVIRDKERDDRKAERAENTSAPMLIDRSADPRQFSSSMNRKGNDTRPRAKPRLPSRRHASREKPSNVTPPIVPPVPIATPTASTSSVFAAPSQPPSRPPSPRPRVQSSLPTARGKSSQPPAPRSPAPSPRVSSRQRASLTRRTATSVRARVAPVREPRALRQDRQRKEPQAAPVAAKAAPAEVKQLQRDLETHPVVDYIARSDVVTRNKVLTPAEKEAAVADHCDLAREWFPRVASGIRCRVLAADMTKSVELFITADLSKCVVAGPNKDLVILLENMRYCWDWKEALTNPAMADAMRSLGLHDLTDDDKRHLFVLNFVDHRDYQQRLWCQGPGVQDTRSIVTCMNILVSFVQHSRMHALQ